MYKVFISYSTKDLHVVSKFKEMLSVPVIDVFISEYSLPPGSKLDEEIIDAIRDCDLFILLWSRNSRKSEWVSQEIGIATTEEKTILPIVLDIGLSLPGFIKNIKYLAAYEDPEKAQNFLRKTVFDMAKKHQKKNGLIWLAIGAAFLWLISSVEE